MPNGLQPVRPGDLITAQWFNDLLTTIDNLEQRLAAVEGGATGSSISISGFVPPNQVAVGQELRVLGSGFRFPPNLNSVTLDGVPVAEFRHGSTSSQLRFLVPALPGEIPNSGRVVTLRIESSGGFAQRAYRVLPEISAEGDPPSITSVARSNGSSTLRIGETAVITGENFGATAPENQIRFIVDLGDGTTHVYPEPGDELTVQATSVSEIQVIVPDMVEVPAVGPFFLSLEITVGAHPPALHTISVRR